MEETKKTPTLPLVKLDTKYKMIIPPFVEQKIRHLCNRVWEKEWSGTLFYKAEGSFEDGSLVITCADIFVMDIGTAGYTEFDMSPDVMTYMTEHPELMECQMGLIHSHNNMSTFFSATDTATLKEEGRDRNHFVSLIVNNAGSYTAAITRKVKSKRVVNETFSYESFEGVLVEATDNWEEEVEEIQYFHLDITKEGNNYSFPDVDTRLAEIKKAKEAKKKQHVIDIKEVKVRYKIDTHDYEVRLKNIRKFITQGNKVKIVVMLRGREMQHSSLAIELANRFIADLANDPVTVEKKPMVEGRNVTAWLAPQGN